jgi:sulfate/thiosulfate transport system substrate-binding protein
VFASGGRDATTNFVERGVGDVLITFENEVRLIVNEFKDRQLEVVVPSLSVRSDNPVAVVAKVAAKNGTTAVAQEYAKWQFSPAAQEIFVKYGLRPSDPQVLARHATEFANVKLFTVDEAFGGWAKAQQTHFSDGGIFDQITGAKR